LFRDDATHSPHRDSERDGCCRREPERDLVREVQRDDNQGNGNQRGSVRPRGDHGRSRLGRFYQSEPDRAVSRREKKPKQALAEWVDRE
jgi:hypothetical protein